MSLNTVVVAVTAAAAATAQPSVMPAQVDAIFARWNHADTPGCAIRVDEGGVPIIDRAYGSADLEHDVAITPDTIFEAGSVSKQFTAAAILLLAEDGKLSLDDDVHRYIPDLPDYGTPLRISHLLHHTSGLRDWGDVAALAGWPRGEATYTMTDIRDIIVRQHGLNFTPGSEWNYSNSNFNLLAMIVERVSGMSFARFTAERIFRPLGMTSTSWRDDYRRIVPRRAIAYSPAEAGYQQTMPFENSIGNGGLLTTAADLQRWNAALMANRLGRDVAERMRERGVLNDGTPISYATGLFVTSHGGLPEVSHGGATGGYRAWAGTYPTRRLSVALLCSSAEVNSAALAHAAVDLVLHVATPVTLAAKSPAAVRYSGFFVDSHDRSLQLTETDGALSAGALGRLTPVSDDRFRTAGGYELKFSGPDAVIVVGENGRTRYRRVAAPTGPVQDAGLAGRYASADVGATYRLIPRDGAIRLELETRPQAGFTAAPVGTDLFMDETQDTVIRLHRDAGGAVDGLSITTSRAFAVPFAKVAEAAPPAATSAARGSSTSRAAVARGQPVE